MTVISLDRCQVIGHRTIERDGYNALIVGAGWKNLNKITNSEVGLFLSANVPPKRHIKEFKIDE